MPRVQLQQSSGRVLVCLIACIVLLLQIYAVIRGGSSRHGLPALNPSLRPETAVLTQTVQAPSKATESQNFGPFQLPKLIHQTVKDKAQLSCQQRKVVASWKALNPDYVHMLWDDTDIQKFMEQYYPELVPIPFNEFLSGAERSDLWRVLVLHQLGGVYADMDVQCLQPIDQWNADHNYDAHVLLGVENHDAGREHPLHVTNWVLAAAPGHPLLGTVMPEIVVKATQHQFFDLARRQGLLNSAEYTKGIIDRTGPGALSWAVYEYFTKHMSVDMKSVDYSNVTAVDGLLVGGVRLLPTDAMAAGWEVAVARKEHRDYTCNHVARDKPTALVCHMFWGSWRDQWGFAQPQTGGEEC